MKTKLITMTLAMLITGALLSGCKLITPYRIDQQQGNVISDDKVAKLHKGMSKDEVRHIMGNPVLISTFDENRWDYVYTFQHSHGPILIHKLTVYFKKHRIIKMINDPNIIKDPHAV